MKVFNLSEEVAEFSEEVIFTLENNGLVISDIYYDNKTDMMFSDALFGFVKHKILTIENGEDVIISINQLKSKNGDSLHLSDALLYSMLCAGMDVDDPFFKTREICAMKLSLIGPILSECKDSIMGELDMWRVIGSCPFEHLNPTDLVVMACDIRDAELLGQDIPKELESDYAMLLETFQEEYGKDTLSRKILVDIMNGKLKDVIHDYAMQQALQDFVRIDINARKLTKESETIPYDATTNSDLEHAKKHAKASAVVNPSVSDILLSYYWQAASMIPLADKKFVKLVPEEPIRDEISGLLTSDTTTSSGEKPPIMGKILPFKHR